MNDMRCPGRTAKLFGLLTPGQVEFSCADCRRSLRSSVKLSHVLHQFEMKTGALIRTVWVWPNGNRTLPHTSQHLT